MIIEKRLYAVREVIVKNGGILPMSLSAVYAGIRAGQIPAMRVGKKVMIPCWYLEEIMAQKPPVAV